MKVTIMGSGTSGGVPRVGGKWGDCDPDEPRNRRRRVSLLVQSSSTNIVVDTSPDFREQVLDARLERLDAVLYTHDHADHTHGIDDIRGFALGSGRKIPLYGDAATLNNLQKRFDYIFHSQEGYPAIGEATVISGPFRIGDIDVLPFVQDHGFSTSLGFRFDKLAYSTDVVRLDEAAFAALEGVDTWIVDALRYETHWTHAHLDLTLDWIERVKPRRAILTHLALEMDYATLVRELPDGVECGYDGMVIADL